ncbi:MAG TPA: GntR family transcriptional regulator [Pseudonocardiaceae bacterium]|jgi:GntR family transcriptional regulator|nr:GntR family transcriptional regulator [Pseudonocardiaceae bacterium]
MSQDEPHERPAQLPSRRIADALRALITTGELAPGDRLPSERELARRFQAARNTAREGVRLLVEEGLVTAQHGRGVFVRNQERIFRWGSNRYSRTAYRETGLTPFRLEMARQGKTARVEVVDIERVAPPPDVAERLGVPADEPSALRRTNHYFADDEPVQVVITYLRWSDAEGTPLLEPRAGPGGIYGRLEECGHTLTEGIDEITARMPSYEESRVLRISPGVPVLDLLHTSINQNGEPFEVSQFVHRGDLAGLLYRFPID